jgi:hypothetical protein
MKWFWRWRQEFGVGRMGKNWDLQHETWWYTGDIVDIIDGFGEFFYELGYHHESYDSPKLEVISL